MPTSSKATKYSATIPGTAAIVTRGTKRVYSHFVVTYLDDEKAARAMSAWHASQVRDVVEITAEDLAEEEAAQAEWEIIWDRKKATPYDSSERRALDRELKAAWSKKDACSASVKRLQNGEIRYSANRSDEWLEMAGTIKALGAVVQGVTCAGRLDLARKSHAKAMEYANDRMKSGGKTCPVFVVKVITLEAVAMPPKAPKTKKATPAPKAPVATPAPKKATPAPKKATPAPKKTSKGRPASGSAIGALRACLAGPFPALKEEALKTIRDAIEMSETTTETCEILNVARSGFDSLRAQFPEIDAPQWGEIDAPALHEKAWVREVLTRGE